VFRQPERRYHLWPNIVDPPGEARSDREILVELAGRLGHGDLISARTPEDVWEEWRQVSAHSAYDFSGITYERLRQEPGILWPCPDEDHPGTCRRYVPGEDPVAKDEGRFDFYGQKDGRAVIWLDEQEPPAEPTDAEYPLELTTGRILEHWHTMTVTGGLERLKGIHPDHVEIHPRDARRFGIGNGQKVSVRSRRGTATFVARQTEDIRPGLVFTTFHSARHLINNTTQDTHDPISKQPAFKKCAVRVEPA
jgi:nitrate reductase NapA